MENLNHLQASRARAFSSPELVEQSPPSSSDRQDDHSLDGIAANVRLLLKLIHDHSEGGLKNNDDRKSLRIAGMMTILDDVRSRLEKSHNSAGKKRLAELRRCNTDLKPNCVPKDKKPQEPVLDEKEKLRKQLSACMASRKSLEIMCSSLGKEKEIMASELAKKVHELNEMEELVSDIRAQNENLMAKIKSCTAEQKEKKGNAGESPGNMELQERNKSLSEQLLRSLDSYRSLKRKYKLAREQNMGSSAKLEEIGQEVAVGLQRLRSFKNKMATGDGQTSNIQEEISALEKMFERFYFKLSKDEKNIGCANSQMNAKEYPVPV